MLLLNMHGAKYSLARAINNLVSVGHNKLFPYCQICFRMPGFAVPERVTARAETRPDKSKKKKKRKAHFSCVRLNARQHCQGNGTHQFKQLAPVSPSKVELARPPVVSGRRRQSKQGVRRLTQGSICIWEVLVSDSAVINHAGPILFSDSSVQGLTFNTHDPGPGCARDHRLQKHQN